MMVICLHRIFLPESRVLPESTVMTLDIRGWCQHPRVWQEVMHGLLRCDKGNDSVLIRAARGLPPLAVGALPPLPRRPAADDGQILALPTPQLETNEQLALPKLVQAGDDGLGRASRASRARALFSQWR